MKEDRLKHYWHANTSSGGTLSLSMQYDGLLSKDGKERLLSESISEAYKHMEREGYIPRDAHLMSSSDIAKEYGSARQYWEKLLNEGKILYAETSAGRITTDLWVKGYLGNREEVNRYVRNVRTILEEVAKETGTHGRVECRQCEGWFEYGSNSEYTNGICRSCGFYVHTNKGKLSWQE